MWSLEYSRELLLADESAHRILLFREKKYYENFLNKSGTDISQI